MYAVGICWRRGGWIFSVYKRRGDAYPTLKVRRVRVKNQRLILKTITEEASGSVGRLGKA